MPTPKSCLKRKHSNLCDACFIPIGGDHEDQVAQERGNLRLCGQCAARYDKHGGYILVNTFGPNITHALCYGGHKFKTTHSHTVSLIDSLKVSALVKRDLIEGVENSKGWCLRDEQGGGEKDEALSSNKAGIALSKYMRQKHGTDDLNGRQRAFLTLLIVSGKVNRMKQGQITTWTALTEVIIVNGNTVGSLVRRGFVEAVVTGNNWPGRTITVYQITNAGRALII